MDCNWMQVLEGSIDPSHVGILHLDTLATMGAGPRGVGSSDFAGEPWDLDMPVPGRRGARGDGQDAPARRPGVWPSDDNAPRIEVENTPFGSTTPRSGTSLTILPMSGATFSAATFCRFCPTPPSLSIRMSSGADE